MKLPSAVRSLSKKLADAVNDTHSVRADIAEARARIGELQRQLLEVSGCPLPGIDVSPRIRAVVKRDGDHWIKTFGSALFIDDTALASPRVANADHVRLPADGKDLMTWGALCAGDPTRAGAFLEALVARVSYQAGPPVAERPALLAELTRELQGLETHEEEAIDQMIDAGIAIEHRPEVIERRQLAGRFNELEAHRVANRRARQTDVDALPKTPTVNLDAVRRTGESNYLKTGRV